jgi:hypothetical protein
MLSFTLACIPKGTKSWSASVGSSGDNIVNADIGNSAGVCSCCGARDSPCEFLLGMTAHVLSMRGQLTAQPVVGQTHSCDDDGSATVLMWNGEAYEGVDGLDAFSNDTTAILSAINKATTAAGSDTAELAKVVPRVLGAVRGPWAAVVWHPASRRLWFGRDFFGRRSLLWKRGVGASCGGCEVLALASVTPRPAGGVSDGGVRGGESGGGGGAAADGHDVPAPCRDADAIPGAGGGNASCLPTISCAGGGASVGPDFDNCTGGSQGVEAGWEEVPATGIHFVEFQTLPDPCISDSAGASRSVAGCIMPSSSAAGLSESFACSAASESVGVLPIAGVDEGVSSEPRFGHVRWSDARRDGSGGDAHRDGDSGHVRWSDARRDGSGGDAHRDGDGDDAMPTPIAPFCEDVPDGQGGESLLKCATRI